MLLQEERCMDCLPEPDQALMKKTAGTAQLE